MKGPFIYKAVDPSMNQIKSNKGMLCDASGMIDFEKSKVSLSTKDVLIHIESETTAQLTANVALNVIAGTFSQYCSELFTVE